MGCYCWITAAGSARHISEWDGNHVSSVSMERPKQETERSGRTMRFRVASANSGRVLAEVFKDERASDAAESDPSPASPAGPQTASWHPSKANSHLSGLVGETAPEENGGEPDELLLYASAKRDVMFGNKRVNICSKNGTIRGVRNKVSAGQVLFNNLANICSGSLRHQKRRPREKE